MKAKYINKASVIGVVAIAVTCSIVLCYGACPNREADSRSEASPACRDCANWTNINDNATCTYTEANGSTIYAACWDSGAQGNQAVQVAPPVLLSGTLWNKKGKCSGGTCANGQPTGPAQYSAYQLTTVPCPQG